MIENIMIINRHSDHTDDIYSSIVAVARSRIIEKHVTLDKNLKGPDDDVSIDFNK